jgi:hypothetical protein
MMSIWQARVLNEDEQPSGRSSAADQATIKERYHAKPTKLAKPANADECLERLGLGNGPLDG